MAFVQRHESRANRVRPYRRRKPLFLHHQFECLCRDPVREDHIRSMPWCAAFRQGKPIRRARAFHASLAAWNRITPGLARRGPS